MRISAPLILRPPKQEDVAANLRAVLEAALAKKREQNMRPPRLPLRGLEDSSPATQGPGKSFSQTTS